MLFRSTYTDENGNKRQKWETFETNAEAKKRKLQVEYEQESGTFIPPSAKTVNDLLDEYMSIYGVNTWAMSTYESRKSLIANYIRPLIGDMKLEDVTPRIMDKYYRDLLSVKAVSSKYVKARTEYLTPILSERFTRHCEMLSIDRKSTRLNSSHKHRSRMPSSA